MRFESNAKPTSATVPTLKKFIEESDSINTKQKFIVDSFWLPNKFPSIGIVTTHFRINLPSSDPNYLELLDTIENCESMDTCFAITITSPENLEYSFEEFPSESCDWELTSFGLAKCVIKEKPKSKRRNASKTRSPKP